MENLNLIIGMSDRQIQDLLRKISMEEDSNILPLALSGVNKEIKECILRNLSTHARAAIENSINELRHNKFQDLEIQKNIQFIISLI